MNQTKSYFINNNWISFEPKIRSTFEILFYGKYRSSMLQEDLPDVAFLLIDVSFRSHYK